jgi:hypothetical protein
MAGTDRVHSPRNARSREAQGCARATSRDITLNRELTHYYDDAGCLIIKARMPAERRALIVKALEMAMDKDFDENDVYPKGT